MSTKIDGNDLYLANVGLVTYNLDVSELMNDGFNFVIDGNGPTLTGCIFDAAGNLVYEAEISDASYQQYISTDTLQIQIIGFAPIF